MRSRPVTNRPAGWPEPGVRRSTRGCSPASEKPNCANAPSWPSALADIDHHRRHRRCAQVRPRAEPGDLAALDPREEALAGAADRASAPAQRTPTRTAVRRTPARRADPAAGSQRGDRDAGRRAVLGASFGGYWAMKLAYTHRERIRGAVNRGGGVHITFTREWQERSRSASSYLMDLMAARARLFGENDVRGLRGALPRAVAA